jgi:hypothetical protein
MFNTLNILVLFQTWCRYRFYDREETVTPKAKGNNPGYAHEELFTFRPVDQQLVDYLRDQAIMITVCGTQKARDSKTHGNAAAKEINNYLNVEQNGVSARPAKKQSTKRRNSVNPGSKSTTARSQSSTREKQPNGTERSRRSASAKKENGAPKVAEVSG